MPTVSLHPPSAARHESAPAPNPLPKLLQTPAGLALLEIQGTINIPLSEDPETSGNDDTIAGSSQQTPVGPLVFPQYSTDAPAEDTSWMKRVHLYVGQHQRLTGEVKKLPQPMAVIRKLSNLGDAMEGVEG